MRYAFERQGWRVAFANDIDRKKQQMYAPISAMRSKSQISITSIRQAFPPSVLPPRLSPAPICRSQVAEKVYPATLFGFLGLSGRVEDMGPRSHRSSWSKTCPAFLLRLVDTICTRR